MWYWSYFFQELLAQPLLGIGPGLAPCTAATTFFAHPHNFYLQIAVEWGLPAGLLAASVIIYVLQSMIRKLRGSVKSPDSVILVIVATGALAAAVHAMFSGVMVMPASQVCCVLVIGYVTALVLQPGNMPASPAEPRSPATGAVVTTTTLVLLILMAIGHLGYFVYTEVPKLESRTNSFVEIHGVPYSPRLWQHGNACYF